MGKLIGSYYPSQKLPDGLGLQGEQLAFAKAHICIAKSVTILFESLKARGASDEQVIPRLCKMLGMSSDAVKTFIKVHTNYGSPKDPQHIKFEYFFLYTVGLKKLSTFVPILKAFYRDRNSSIAKRVSMTKKSIELHMLVDTDCYRWVHLANLSVEQLESFMKEFTVGANIENKQPNIPSVSATATSTPQSQHTHSQPLDKGNALDPTGNQLAADKDEKSTLAAFNVASTEGSCGDVVAVSPSTDMFAGIFD